MTAGKHRVVVWATGGIGSIAIRAIHQRPNLDLVGVWVHSPEKDGMDAGELANGEPIGLAVTTDADALIALKPDCVIYAASGPGARRAGDPRLRRNCSTPDINVVTTSTTGWSIRTPTSRRSGATSWSPRPRQGQVSLYASGIEPGFRRRLPCRWSCPRNRRRSRRSTPTRSVSTTTTACPTS